jgi:uncharacterized BrkB/YihY/UPF0761 family membrane protein
MTKRGLIRFIVTFSFMSWALSVLFYKALPSGITWKIVAASLGALIATGFFVLSLIYRKKA